MASEHNCSHCTSHVQQGYCGRAAPCWPFPCFGGCDGGSDSRAHVV